MTTHLLPFAAQPGTVLTRCGLTRGPALRTSDSAECDCLPCLNYIAEGKSTPAESLLVHWAPDGTNDEQATAACGVHIRPANASPYATSDEYADVDCPECHALMPMPHDRLVVGTRVRNIAPVHGPTGYLMDIVARHDTEVGTWLGYVEAREGRPLATSRPIWTQISNHQYVDAGPRPLPFECYETYAVFARHGCAWTKTATDNNGVTAIAMRLHIRPDGSIDRTLPDGTVTTMPAVTDLP